MTRILWSDDQPEVHLFTPAEKVLIHSGVALNFKAPTESTLFFSFLADWRLQIKTGMLILVTRPGGYTVDLCAIVCTWLNVCVCSLYLWVETEGLGRFPNTQQVKYDLLHGEIQSLLNGGQTYRCYRISELMWCEAATTCTVWNILIT